MNQTIRKQKVLIKKNKLANEVLLRLGTILVFVLVFVKMMTFTAREWTDSMRIQPGTRYESSKPFVKVYDRSTMHAGKPFEIVERLKEYVKPFGCTYDQLDIFPLTFVFVNGSKTNELQCTLLEDLFPFNLQWEITTYKSQWLAGTVTVDVNLSGVVADKKLCSSILDNAAVILTQDTNSIRGNTHPFVLRTWCWVTTDKEFICDLVLRNSGAIEDVLVENNLPKSFVHATFNPEVKRILKLVSHAWKSTLHKFSPSMQIHSLRLDWRVDVSGVVRLLGISRFPLSKVKTTLFPGRDVNVRDEKYLMELSKGWTKIVPGTTHFNPCKEFATYNSVG